MHPDIYKFEYPHMLRKQQLVSYTVFRNDHNRLEGPFRIINNLKYFFGDHPFSFYLQQ